MIRCEAARIDLDAGLNVWSESELIADHLAEFANLAWLQECWCPAAPVQLHSLAARADYRRHLREFLLEIVEVGGALPLLCGDDGRATAEPAKRLAEGKVEIQRKVALSAVVGRQFLGQVWCLDFVRELGRRRIRGVA